MLQKYQKYYVKGVLATSSDRPPKCIGNHFAMMEMQLLLAELVRQFGHELVTSHAVEPHPSSRANLNTG